MGSELDDTDTPSFILPFHHSCELQHSRPHLLFYDIRFMIVVRPILSPAFFFLIYIRLRDITLLIYSIFFWAFRVEGVSGAWHTLCRGQKAPLQLSFCSCPSEKKSEGGKLNCQKGNCSVISIPSAPPVLQHRARFRFCIFCNSEEAWWTVQYVPTPRSVNDGCDQLEEKRTCSRGSWPLTSG